MKANRLKDYLFYQDDWATIYCGDCLEIIPQFESIDLIITDPPYNVDKNYGIYKDNLDKFKYNQLIDFITKQTENIILILGSQCLLKWWQKLPNAKLVIILVKAGMSAFKPKQFVPKFRPLLTTVNSNEFWGDVWDDIRWSGEGYFFNEENYNHPAITPLKLIKRSINIFSQPKQLILDPFLGSGTTCVAAKNLNRKSIGIEINPTYCDIAVKRLRQEVFDFSNQR